MIDHLRETFHGDGALESIELACSGYLLFVFCDVHRSSDKVFGRFCMSFYVLYTLMRG